MNSTSDRTMMRIAGYRSDFLFASNYVDNSIVAICVVSTGLDSI